MKVAQRGPAWQRSRADDTGIALRCESSSQIRASAISWDVRNQHQCREARSVENGWLTSISGSAFTLPVLLVEVKGFGRGHDAQHIRGGPTLKSELQSYSVRNAVIGVIFVARRAGSHVASKVAIASSSGAVENATGSSAPI
jgi:hypothetical protein